MTSKLSVLNQPPFTSQLLWKFRSHRQTGDTHRRKQRACQEGPKEGTLHPGAGCLAAALMCWEITTQWATGTAAWCLCCPWPCCVCAAWRLAQGMVRVGWRGCLPLSLGAPASPPLDLSGWPGLLTVWSWPRESTPVARGEAAFMARSILGSYTCLVCLVARANPRLTQTEQRPDGRESVAFVIPQVYSLSLLSPCLLRSQVPYPAHDPRLCLKEGRADKASYPQQ